MSQIAHQSPRRINATDLKIAEQAKQAVTGPCPYWPEDEPQKSHGPCGLCEASAILAALSDAGRLLPADGKQCTQHEIDWWHGEREQDNPTMTYEDFTEQQIDEEIEQAAHLGYEPREIRRRVITTWSDGATFTGAWESR